MSVKFKCRHNPFLTVPYEAVMTAVYTVHTPFQRLYSGSGTPVTIQERDEVAYSFEAMDNQCSYSKPPFQFFNGYLTLTDETEIEAFREWIKHGHTDEVQEVTE